MIGKTVVLGVTGSIAAYNAADIASKLTQAGARVEVIMTESATPFISPLTPRPRLISSPGWPTVSPMTCSVARCWRPRRRLSWHQP